MPVREFATQDAVPEEKRASAIERKDGKWIVVEEPDVTNLQTALEKERTERSNAEKAAKDEKKRADSLQRAAEAKEKGISEEELAKIRDDEAKARKPIEEERDRLAAENRTLKLTNRVKQLALTAGIMPDRIEDAMLALERRTDLGDKDGIIVKDKAGNVTTEKVEDFLAKTFKLEKPWLYSGTGASGSGSPGSEGGTSPGGFDPVAAGKADAKNQIADRENRKRAFT